MPSTTKIKNVAMAAQMSALPTIPNELIDQFVSGQMSARAVSGASTAFKNRTRVMNRS